MTILCYHAVDPDWHSPLSVPPDVLRAQCRWLTRNRRVVALGQAVALGERSSIPGGMCVLTFDDGFASVYEHALPVLREERLPATVFIVAATLTAQGQPVDWVDDPPSHTLRTLTLEQLLEMREAGVGIGSHSWAHRNLVDLGDGECIAELRDSRELLEDLLRQPVPFFAYPRGLHNARVRTLTQQAGYTHGFALPEAWEPRGPYALPRVGIYPYDASAALRAKTSAWYVPVRMSPVFPALRAASGRGVLARSIRRSRS